MEDQIHFEAVLASDSVRAALSRHGLDRVSTWKRGRDHNDGMKAYKDDWTIPLPAAGIEGVNVHFEARRRGELQVDVEVFPYEGGIAKDPARLAELAPHMALKARLIRAIRSELGHDDRCVRELGARVRGLRDPDVPSTLCAVKFQSGHGTSGTADTDAAFVARVVHHVAPALDRIVTAAAAG